MDRNTYIGGSDAARIVAGDWLALYEEKVGIRQPEDLSRVFKVQLGKYTEGFHLDWLAYKHGLNLRYPMNWKRHLDHEFIGGTIDAWWTDKDTFIDTKHSNAFMDAREQGEMHQAQVAHYCNVYGVDHGYLSVIPGNEEPYLVKVEPSKAYRDELLELELAFWFHIETGSAPETVIKRLGKVEAEAPKLKINGMRKVDMTGNNQWADYASDIVTYQDAAKKFEAAKDGIKKLVEPDVAEAYGHGVAFKRDARGALRMTLKEAA
jgi:predicted phage-related endonuclease